MRIVDREGNKEEYMEESARNGPEEGGGVRGGKREERAKRRVGDGDGGGVGISQAAYGAIAGEVMLWAGGKGTRGGTRGRGERGVRDVGGRGFLRM